MQGFQPLLKENRETLLAPKAPASRGVWAHTPLGNFANLLVGSLKSRSCLSANLELPNGVRLLA